MQAPHNCHVMAKPTGSVCNLDCSYCFYLEKHQLYPERQTNWRMSDDTLSSYIKQTIEAQSNNHVQFTWQGGEPTMMGLAFFEKAMQLCEQYGKGKKLEHTFQTNGILLNDAWCEFFKKHHFLVGVSIDGPQDLHDAYRVTRSGKQTHAQVMQGIEFLKKHGVEFNTLTVVNNENVKHPKRVYQHLKEIGSTYIQFIPLVERTKQTCSQTDLKLVLPDEPLAEVTSWSVPSQAYGEFLCDIFDVWVRKDVGSIFVNMFDSTLSAWCGQQSGMCHFTERCGHAFALEANGDLYNCDHYVYPEHCLGNIHHKSISECNNSQQAIEFGLQKQTTLTPDCKKCPFQFACNGGCPKHRFERSSSGHPGHNYFCQGYRKFFEYSAQYMKEMRRLLSVGRFADEIMWALAYQDVKLTAVVSKSSVTIGRNQSCSCGSGIKYKHCCGVRR